MKLIDYLFWSFRCPTERKKKNPALLLYPFCICIDENWYEIKQSGDSSWSNKTQYFLLNEIYNSGWKELIVERNNCWCYELKGPAKTKAYFQALRFWKKSTTS